MTDVALRCTLFRAQMILSYCATKCVHAGRGTLRCPDLVRLAKEQPAAMCDTVATIVGEGKPLHASFKCAFPDLVPGAVQTPPPLLTPPTAPKTRVVSKPTEMLITPTSALEVKSIPILAPITENEKEKTMSNPTQPEPSVPVPVKRKGGVPKGYKFSASRMTSKAAEKPITPAPIAAGRSRNIGMLFFVETAPKSGHFTIEALKEFGDVMTILDGSNRRVIGTVSAREF